MLQEWQQTEGRDRAGSDRQFPGNTAAGTQRLKRWGSEDGYGHTGRDGNL
jgi:hypothetical protein